MAEHKWDFCGYCGSMVTCGTCNNNCCNAGHGTLEDGSECPDCNDAYEMQLNPTEEQTRDRIRFLNEKCKELYAELHKDDDQVFKRIYEANESKRSTESSNNL